MEVIQEIDESFAGLRIGTPKVHLNLALVPLFDDGDNAAGYLLLDDALERKLARVTEVSADGRVPELAFENDSAEKILLVDGDELVGGRQKLVIPVSCVEQGRWRYHSRDFQSARRSLFAKARAKKMRQVTESLRVNQDRRSNQSEVWADVAGKVAFCQADSDTLAMADAYESRGRQVSGYVSAFRAQQGQRGAVVAIDGKPVGLELFDSANAFARYLEKLVRSYALDAIETEAGKVLAPPEEDVRRFLDSIRSAAAERFPALGEGEDIRLTGEGVSGGALAANGRVVHLAGFAVA